MNAMLTPAHDGTFIQVPLMAFVFKVTERCNLVCPYCYFFFSEDQTHRDHPAIVPMSTVDGMIQFIQDAIQRHGVQTVQIGFHGGEPLLLKKAFFERVCSKLIDELGDRCELRLSLQTNGVLIDREWIALFAKYRFSVGMSFDGNEEAHNQTRIDRKGRGTYAESERGWRMLLEAADAGHIRMVGVLCVVAPGQSGRKMFRHFIDNLNVRTLDFLLPDVTHNSLTASKKFVEQCGDYLIEVCDEWFSRADPGIRVRFISDIIEPLLARVDESIPAVLHPEPRTLTVSSNGDLGPDDSYRPLAMRFRDTGYNVGQHRYANLQAGEFYQEMVRAATTLPEACNGCAWRGICRGGDRKHRFSIRNGFDKRSVYCSALYRLHAYICARLVQGGIPAERLEQRLLYLAEMKPQSAAPAPAAAQPGGIVSKSRASDIGVPGY